MLDIASKDLEREIAEKKRISTENTKLKDKINIMNIISLE